MFTHLLIHNIVAISTSVTNIGLFLFIFLNNPRSKIHITFALTMLCAAIFSLSHVIGANIIDPELSRHVFMFNIFTMFIAIFNAHAVGIMTGAKRGPFSLIAWIYYSGIIFSIIYLIFPSLFLLPSVPKMYFPNYYNPGSLNFIRLIITYVFGVGYMFSHLFLSYRQNKNSVYRGQVRYFALAIFLGYGLGFIPNFLVYDIKIDPLFGMTFAVFAVPIIFGVVKYELLNVKIIAKQAFVYTLSIGLVGGFVLLASYISQIVRELNPGFPVWIIPLTISFIVVTSGVFVWRKLRESDLLKYEFVTTVTHKFRTPLTHIKWAAENISKLSTDPELKNELGYIQSANGKLVELTTLVMNVAGTEDSAYEYRYEKHDVSKIVAETIRSVQYQADAKKISINQKITPELYSVCDEERIRFVTQTFIENGIHYTGSNGEITVSVSLDQKNDIVVSVSDTGVGVSAEDMPHMFTKFYRGEKARSLDTEGMGIGLYMSKEIIKKHNRAKIWINSEGTDKGSTFSFSLPQVK